MLWQVGPVAVIGVRGEGSAQEPREGQLGAGLARLPDLGEPGGPRPPCLGLERAEREAGRLRRRRRQRLRRGQRRDRRRLAQARAPVRREDGVRAALAGTDGVRVEEQVGGGHDDGLDTAAGERRGHGVVVGALVGLQAGRPHDRAGARCARQLGQGDRRIAPPERQPRAQPAQLAVKRDQRVPQPPAPGRAGRPAAPLSRLPDEHGEEVAAVFPGPRDGRGQRRVVAQPQVAAKPEQRRLRWRHVFPPFWHRTAPLASRPRP